MAKRFSWNSDMVVSICAMVISLFTLVVFVYQTNLMRKQQYLSVMPYLSIVNSGTGTANFAVLLTNDGLGPAFVESNNIIYKDKTYEMDLPDFLNKHVPDLDTVQFFYSNIYPGRMIPPGETIKIIEFRGNQEDVSVFYQVMDTLGAQLDFELIYRSIYEERWSLGTESNIPTKLNSKNGSLLNER